MFFVTITLNFYLKKNIVIYFEEKRTKKFIQINVIMNIDTKNLIEHLVMIVENIRLKIVIGKYSHEFANYLKIR